MENSDYIFFLREMGILHNGERGIGVFHSAIAYLKRDDLESAKVVLLTDRDKLWQYPGLVDSLIKVKLLPPME